MHFRAQVGRKHGRQSGAIKRPGSMAGPVWEGYALSGEHMPAELFGWLLLHNLRLLKVAHDQPVQSDKKPNRR